MASTTKSFKVAILGATGEVGKHTLLSTLSNPLVNSVIAFGRKAPSISPTTEGFSKLTSVSVDFDKLLQGNEEEQIKLSNSQPDVVLITLGTTLKSAGSMENFVKIDREYVLSAAKALKSDKLEQKLVYCSSGGSNSSAMFPYLKSKGLTEEGLASLGYGETIIFRPGYLAVPGGRGESRFIEGILGRVMNVASHFTNHAQIETPILGSAIVRSALDNSKKVGVKEMLKGNEVWVIGNPQAITLGSD